MKKKVILIIAYNTLHNDPRILRQIDSLKDEFNIITAGYSDPGPGVKFVKLENWEFKMIDFYFNYPVLLRKIFAAGTLVYINVAKFFRIAFRKMATAITGPAYAYERDYWVKTKIKHKALKGLNPDLIIANDIDTLPLADKIAGGKSKLVFDAHEYHPSELEEVEEWKLNEQPRIIYMCKRYLKKADLMMTVSDPIAREYQKIYKVDPVVILNAPKFQALVATSVQDRIKLVHHGSAIRQRFLEETINVMDFLGENYTLDLFLVPTDPEYFNFLREKYKNEKRIIFRASVPTKEISEKINDYDIGIYILPPLNFNNINALPNKFFEFIQARLAIAIGPMVAMSEIVKEYKLGVVSEKFTSDSLASAIKTMSKDEIFQCKKRSESIAMKFSAEKNKEIMLTEIKKLLN